MTVETNIPLIVVVGGPAGTGKTTIGSRLASEVGCLFIEGDRLHPQENIDKMANDIPFTDEDRWDWLGKIAQCAAQEVLGNEKHSASDVKPRMVVVSCSMLKKSYRKYIREHVDLYVSQLQTQAMGTRSEPTNNIIYASRPKVNILFAFLWASMDTLVRRTDARASHYMKSTMVASQYQIMEVPSDEELIDPNDPRTDPEYHASFLKHKQKHGDAMVIDSETNIDFILKDIKQEILDYYF